jgi:hypothetical protein
MASAQKHVEYSVYNLLSCYLTTKSSSRLSKIVAGVEELAGLGDFAESDAEVRICLLVLALLYDLITTAIVVFLRAHTSDVLHQNSNELIWLI